MREGAVIFFLALSVLGAGVVAPTKSDVEAMYAAAAQELNAGHYHEALGKLDELEARQPDVAAAQNLRGVAWMRLREFRKAETALRKARELDPNFWEARFNLAEVPFLSGNWAEARRRFTALLAEPNDRWQGATGDLMQFKILLTYLLEGQEKAGAPILEKLQAATESPAPYYAKAALALQRKERKEAMSWMKTAGQEFSPESNKLFTESFYEVGWLSKPEGALPVALELISPAERIERAQKDLAQAERAYRRGDFDEAWKMLEDIETTTPGQAVAYNLRGEVLLAQGMIEEAGEALQNALAADPQLLSARYNLARVSIARKEYETARKDLEALLGAASGSKDQARTEQLIRYQIFLTLLLQGREGAAQKAMDEFKMMDGSPALYYAQAAWAFQHGNAQEGSNWVANAGNLFSKELNRSFAFSFADLGWLKPKGVPAQSVATPATVAKARTAPTPEVGDTPLAVPRMRPPSAVPREMPSPVAELAEATATPIPVTPQPASSPSPAKVASVEEKPTPQPAPTPNREEQERVANAGSLAEENVARAPAREPEAVSSVPAIERVANANAVAEKPVEKEPDPKPEATRAAKSKEHLASTDVPTEHRVERKPIPRREETPVPEKKKSVARTNARTGDRLEKELDRQRAARAALEKKEGSSRVSSAARESAARANRIAAQLESGRSSPPASSPREESPPVRQNLGDKIVRLLSFPFKQPKEKPPPGRSEPTPRAPR
ncbi:hypothetical protein BH20VER3_BH20VER3_18210 [soil metagenome]